MGAADTLQEFGLYGAYDLAINKWLRSVFTAVEPTTIVVQASPQRAFGDAAAMVAKGLADPQRTLTEPFNRDALMPLPLISVQPSAPEPRENQRLVPCKNLFRKSLPGTDPTLRERYVAQPPLPVWLNYTCEVWTKTRSTMNALITGFMRKFDPHMSWGEVVIDDNFWGTVWMPIHMQGMTDNSELEAGEKDRLLRHTVTLRVEAWCFFPPMKDFTVEKTTIDKDESHLQHLEYVSASHFSCIYMAAQAHKIYKIGVTSAGQLNVIPVDAPPNPITHFYGKKLIVFNQGFVLDQYSIFYPGRIIHWEYKYNNDISQAQLVASRIQSALDTLPPLFVSEKQQLLIGEGGFYIQPVLLRTLNIGYRPRYILDFNEEPIAPPLPYQTVTPG